jgi:hypothetical protein
MGVVIVRWCVVGAGRGPWLAVASPCGLACVLLPCASRRCGMSLVSPCLLASQTTSSRCAAHRAGPMLRSPSLGYCGISLALRSINHIKPLGMCCYRVASRGAGNNGDGMPLPRLSPLADAGELCSGRAMPLHERRAKPFLSHSLCARAGAASIY